MLYCFNNQPQSLNPGTAALGPLTGSSYTLFNAASCVAGLEIHMTLSLGRTHLSCELGNGQGQCLGSLTQDCVSGHRYCGHGLSRTRCSWDSGLRCCCCCCWPNGFPLKLNWNAVAEVARSSQKTRWCGLSMGTFSVCSVWISL